MGNSVTKRRNMETRKRMPEIHAHAHFSLGAARTARVAASPASRHLGHLARSLTTGRSGKNALGPTRSAAITMFTGYGRVGIVHFPQRLTDLAAILADIFV